MCQWVCKFAETMILFEKVGYEGESGMKIFENLNKENVGKAIDIAQRKIKQEGNRDDCIAELVKVKGLTEEEAKKELKATRKALGVPYPVYLEYGFASMTPEEQKHKAWKLIGTGNFRGPEFQLRDEAIFRAAEANGWTYKEAKNDLKQSRDKYGIKTSEYLYNMFYKVSDELRNDYAARIIKEREHDAEVKVQKEEALKAKIRIYIDRVVEETGLPRSEVRAMMDRAKEVTGSTKEHYTIYRFWELTEEEQKTYFTTGASHKVIEKYSEPQISAKRMMNHKEVFYEDLKEYLGRRYLHTALMDWDEFRDMFINEEKLVYKARTGGGGKSVRVYSVTGEERLREIYDEIRQLPFGLVETFLKQHPDMQQFSEKSVNTIRIVVIRTNNPADNIEVGKVHFVYAGLRMNTGDSYLDNLHSGGAIAAIDVDTGIMVTGAANHLNQLYDVHPKTGAQIKGAKVPFFEDAKALVEKVMLEKDIEGYFGWDVAITVDGPVLVEGNNNPGADGLQLPYVPCKKGMKYLFDEYLK